MLLRMIRATLLVSIPLDSLLLALLAMGGPPCGVSLVHALGVFLGRDALHSIDFLEDGGLVLAGHVLEALQCDVPILGEVDTAGAAGRPWLPMRHAGLEVGSEHVTPHVDSLPIVLDEGVAGKLHGPERIAGFPVRMLRHLPVVHIDPRGVLVTARFLLLVLRGLRFHGKAPFS